MEMSYKEYLKTKKRKVELSNTLEFFIKGSGDIPLLGNTIKATVTRASEMFSQKTDFSSAVSKPQDINHFVVLADDYYTKISMKAFRILELEKIKKKYEYMMNAIQLKLVESFNNETKELEDTSLFINFLDNKYYNTNLKSYDYGSISITFKENFKQINFDDNRVYIAFEIISIGGNNQFNDSNRDYIEFSKLVCYLLNSKI